MAGWPWKRVATHEKLRRRPSAARGKAKMKVRRGRRMAVKVPWYKARTGKAWRGGFIVGHGAQFGRQWWPRPSVVCARVSTDGDGECSGAARLAKREREQQGRVEGMDAWRFGGGAVRHGRHTHGHAASLAKTLWRMVATPSLRGNSSSTWQMLLWVGWDADLGPFRADLGLGPKIKFSLLLKLYNFD
jgi:hypothetical protein